MNIKWLYSLGCAFVLLLSVALWFALGMALSEQDSSGKVLEILNDLPMAEWYQHLLSAPLVASWLLGLLILMFLLGLNTVLCSWRDLWPTWRQKRWRSPRIMMLPIHLLTLVIFICHGIDLVFIHGHETQVLQVGQSFDSGRFKLVLNRVDYRDDIALIQEDADGCSPAGRITRRSVSDFDPRHNFAYFTVSDGQQVFSSRAGFMSPMKWQDLYIIVTDFTVPYMQIKKGVQVKVVVVHNRLINYFFGFYNLLLVSLLVQILIFWKRASRKEQRV
ncbi:MAG: hypothetical protein V5788_02850 [Shewanella sp.]